jgi:hypothetical protein
MPRLVIQADAPRVDDACEREAVLAGKGTGRGECRGVRARERVRCRLMSRGLTDPMDGGAARTPMALEDVRP